MRGTSYKRSIANTYQAHRSFDNDLFKHRKQPKKYKLILVLLLFVAICGGVGWFLTRPFFFLQAIEVKGTETLDAYTVQDQILNTLEGDKFLGVSRMHILRHQDQKVHELLSSYSLASINVQKQKRILTITIQEQAQGGLVHASHKWMLYNLQGSFVRDLNEEEVGYVNKIINNETPEKTLFYRDTPLIEFGNQDIAVNTSVPQFTVIKNMHDALIHEGRRPLMHIISDEQILWAEARMREGYNVRYDLSRDVKEQLEQFATVVRELQGSAPSPRVIDVRFDGRVYVQ